jgi:LemA protein
VNINPNQAPADAAQLEKFEQAQGQLGSALSRLLVVAERYPELKATQNFAGLQAELAGTENRISVERMRFNEAVQDYNTSVQRLPTRLYAGAMGFNPKPYFQSVAGSEAPPKVQFDFNKK